MNCNDPNYADVLLNPRTVNADLLAFIEDRSAIASAARLLIAEGERSLHRSAHSACAAVTYISRGVAGTEQPAATENKPMRKLVWTAALTILLTDMAIAAPLAPPWQDGSDAFHASGLIDRDVALRGGVAMGRDPDAHVRFELRRDNPTY
jgi:hypothetical protein